MKKDDERKIFAFRYTYDNLDVNLKIFKNLKKKGCKTRHSEIALKFSNSGDFILSKILNKRNRIWTFDNEIFILLFICFILNCII